MESDRPVRKYPIRLGVIGEPPRKWRSLNLGVRARRFRRTGEMPSGRCIKWLGTERSNRFCAWTVETWSGIERVGPSPLAKRVMIASAPGVRALIVAPKPVRPGVEGRRKVDE